MEHDPDTKRTSDMAPDFELNVLTAIGLDL